MVFDLVRESWSCQRFRLVRMWPVLGLVSGVLAMAGVAPASAGGREAPGQTEAQIVGTLAAGEDLVVSLAWSPETAVDWAQIVLLDPAGTVAAATEVAVTPGRLTQAVVSGFLARVPQEGFQFAVVPRDGAGRDLAGPHPFRVFFDCLEDHDPAVCSWRVVGGLESTSRIMTEALRRALEGSGSRDTADWLQDVLTTWPALRGQILTLASQLDFLDQQGQLGSECICDWSASFALEPKVTVTHATDSPGTDPGWQTRSRAGAGAHVAAAAQSRSMTTPISVVAEGETRLSVWIDCKRILEWVPYEISMAEGLLTRWIRFPRVVPCEGFCLAQMEFQAELEGKVSLSGWQEAGASNDIFARASVEGLLTVDTMTHPLEFLGPYGPSHECIGTGCPTSAGGLLYNVGGTILELAETVSGEGIFETRVELLLESSAAGQRCLACATNEARFSATGTSDCTLEPGSFFSFQPEIEGEKMGGVCGELDISPWDP